MSLTEVQPSAAPEVPSSRTAVTRLGVVRYLNTRPLIAGLERLEGLRMRGEVPAELIGTLERGETDAALCSSIDYQRSELDLLVLPVGLLGCDGPTMTVKIFSRVPLERVRRLHADADSHTSRVLAQLVLGHRNGSAPELVDGLPGEAEASEAEAMLLIGDKVVLRAPDAAAFPHTLDLGQAWKAWTGLPFTFACWFARRPEDAASLERLRALARLLDHQRRRNAMRRESLAAIEARAHGWPVPEAQLYLNELLRFEWNARQREGLELFWRRAFEAGLVARHRPLVTLESACLPAPACA
jgi:chorismate dehydratase